MTTTLVGHFIHRFFVAKNIVATFEAKNLQKSKFFAPVYTQTAFCELKHHQLNPIPRFLHALFSLSLINLISIALNHLDILKRY